MKHALLNQWRPLTEDRSVLWLKYSFGPGTANSLAAKLPDGTWLVISPPSDAPAAVYDALDRDGSVSVLIAPNAYHNKGQAEWRARFPRAIGCAPSGAHARLSKKTPGIVYQSLEALQVKLLPMRIVLPEGMKTPDTLVHIPTPAGSIWWMGDLFSNSSASDQIWALRILAKLAGSGLGYRANAKPEVVYVRDRPVWLDSIRSALEASPPSIVVPAHGDPVIDDAADRTRRAADAIDIRTARSSERPS